MTTPNIIPVPAGLPKGEWSAPAIRVLEERYLWKDETGKVAETPDEAMWRVARAIALAEEQEERAYQRAGSRVDWGDRVVDRRIYAWAEKFYRELVSRRFMPNSPTIANAGKGNGLASAACYVIPVEDSLEGIFDALKWQALIHQTGGGTGFSFSRLRPNGSMVGSTKGVASGPVSFMKIFDVATEQVKQGGMRRGANMGILRVDHPDILEFVRCKMQDAKTGRYPIQNFNISVAITDEFMDALAGGGTAHSDGFLYDLVDPHTDQVTTCLDARTVWAAIIECAHATGDPGLWFIDRANASRANPLPDLYQLESTNPCFSADTLLYTAFGIQRVGDLHQSQIPQTVTTDGRFGAGTFQEATPVFSTGVKPVYRLRTVEGYEVKVTADHKIMTDRGYVPAGELTKADRIHILNRKGGFGTEGALEQGQVFGWLVGDGFASEGRAGLDFYGEKQELAEYFAGLVNSMVDGMQEAQRVYTVGVQIVKDREVLRVRSTRLARLAEEWGASKDSVSDRIMVASEEFQRGFLQALFSADGTVADRRSNGAGVRLTAVSEDLLLDVQRMLLNFGIFARLYRNRRPAMVRAMPDGHGGLKDYPTQAYHELHISRSNMTVFRDEIGFILTAKRDRLNALLDGYTEGPYREKFTARLDTFEYVKDEPVYDITVDTVHSIVINGIVASNCGEQALEPFGVCNLGSLNLAEFVEIGNVTTSINWKLLSESVHTAVRFLDNVITVNSYPHPEIDYWAKAGRRIGLGVMGWADLLMKLRIPYASEQARDLGEQVMGFIDEAAFGASLDLAEERGPFLLFDRSIYKDGLPLRNCARTTVAPTGTISIIAGCSSGIEPVFALAYQHRVGERVLSFVNPYVEERLKQLALPTDEPGLDPTLIRKHIAATGQYPKLGTYPQDIAVFKTALEIAPADHVLMQAAFQRYVDNSISKTVNLPFMATVEDVDAAYRLAWETDCMGITVFRTGSKDGVQVLYAGTDTEAQKDARKWTPSKDDEEASFVAAKEMIRMMGTRQEEQQPPSLTLAMLDELLERQPPAVIKARPHRVTGSTVEMDTPLGHAFITVNSDDEGQPLEVFVTIGKAGSDTQADAEAIGRLLSLLFRVPSTMTPKARAAEAIEQLRGIGGRTSRGFGPDRVRSVPDAIAQVLQESMLEARKDTLKEKFARESMTAIKHEDVIRTSLRFNADFFQEATADTPASWPEGQRADLCPQCGDAALIHQEGCVTCLACAYTEC